METTDESGDLLWWTSVADGRILESFDISQLTKIIVLLLHARKDHFSNILRHRADLDQDDKELLLRACDDTKKRLQKTFQWTVDCLSGSRISDDGIDGVVRENFKRLEFVALVSEVLEIPCKMTKEFNEKVLELPNPLDTKRLHRITALKALGENDLLKDFKSGIRACISRQENLEDAAAFSLLLQRLELVYLRFEGLQSATDFHDGRLRLFQDFKLMEMLGRNESVEIALMVTRNDMTAFKGLLKSCGQYGFNDKDFPFNPELRKIADDWDALTADLAVIPKVLPGSLRTILDVAYQCLLLTNFHSFSAFSMQIPPEILKLFPPVKRFVTMQLYFYNEGFRDVLDDKHHALPCLLPFVRELAPKKIKREVSQKVVKMIDRYEIGLNTLLLHPLQLPDEATESEQDSCMSEQNTLSQAYQRQREDKPRLRKMKSMKNFLKF